MNQLMIIKIKRKRVLALRICPIKKIKDLSTLNKTFLGKWYQKFTLQKDMLWRNYIDGKFGEILYMESLEKNREVGALRQGKKVTVLASTSRSIKGKEFLKPKKIFEVDNKRIIKF